MDNFSKRLNERENFQIYMKNCVICLEDVTELKFCKINCCSHLFHYKCIKTWADIQNTCPTCRMRFERIIKCNNGNEEKIEVEEKNQLPVPNEILDDILSEYYLSVYMFGNHTILFEYLANSVTIYLGTPELFGGPVNTDFFDPSPQWTPWNCGHIGSPFDIPLAPQKIMCDKSTQTKKQKKSGRFHVIRERHYKKYNYFCNKRGQNVRKFKNKYMRRDTKYL